MFFGQPRKKYLFEIMPSGWLKGGEQSPHLVPRKYPSQYDLWERESINSENNCFSKAGNWHIQSIH